MSKFRLKKKIVTPSAWQVWITYVPFEDDTSGKKRPVLVTETNGLSCTIAEISSKSPTYGSDIHVFDIVTAGLEKESVVKTWKTRTVPRKSLMCKLGYLSSTDRCRVKEVIKGSGC